MKIGIVNDRRAAECLTHALLTGDHQVTWVATCPSELAERCGGTPPDLVLVNVHMSGLDGLEAARRIVKELASAVLVTVAEQSDPARVFEALGVGALDAVALPPLATSQFADIAPPLLAKIGTISRLIGKTERTKRPAEVDAAPAAEQLIAIGASAGGPAALAVVLNHLPKDLPAGIVVVQHLGEDFTEGVAKWLDESTDLDVRVAREDDRPAAGTVLVAGGNEHLVFKTGSRLGYTPDPIDKVYRPSIDVFFQSVCRLWRGPVVGVLLTGMGKDGAQGLKALRGSGHHTIAQDQATCAVYGMPKAAAAMNAAVDILPIERIAERLKDLALITPARTVR
jgi:two-component system response regulator WspF